MLLHYQQMAHSTDTRTAVAPNQVTLSSSATDGEVKEDCEVASQTKANSEQ